MEVHIYIYIYTYTHTHTYIYIYIHTHMHMLIYIYMLPPPSVIYLFRGFPGHVGEHVPKTRGHVQFLIRVRVYRLWHCAVRIVFI